MTYKKDGNLPSFIVATKVGDNWEKCFQVREMKGIINKAGQWEEIEPIRTRYDPVYKIGEEVIPDERLVTEYEVFDVTDVVLALDALFAKAGEIKVYPHFKRIELKNFSQINPESDYWEKAIKAVQAKLAE